MPKFSFSHILTFILIISVISRISEAGPKRCQKVLNTINCNLLECGKACYNTYKDFQGFGQCIRNINNDSYECLCVYDCNANKSGA
ncbi:S locus-related glycoprotein 1 binding pollen coat protein [Vigna unguiculata]|uniref:S locus-related glycoprotein 1 binding pollen coat protein n=1 Tax=Vigna unguiculata TaxID=3917 RepID=A0A4D6MSR8_VIGUN|nr:S locus-related glycoprotein 1 binding pollen coat protein [Vigna unguiculata]